MPSNPPSAPIRLACVQNGNFTEALDRLAAGGPETYQGQRYTIDAFQKFVAGHSHLVISADVPSHRQSRGNAELVGIPKPPRFRFIPGRIRERWLARRIIHQLNAFKPTHLLLRIHDVAGCKILQWAARRNLPVAIIIAATFRREHPPHVQFCTLANQSNVAFIANHNRVATDSLIACGLQKDKAIAWDYVPAHTPAEHPPRTRSASADLALLFAGKVSDAKGVPETIAAVESMRRDGRNVSLTLCGEGPYLPTVLEHPGVQAGWLNALGRVPNDVVHEKMAQADFVVVPSRHSFPEGLPLVIQEGLAMRTPLLLSDHPVFAGYFRDGQGIRFFLAENPAALAKLVLELANDPSQYARLSDETAAAWQSFQIPTKFHHLLEDLSKRWGLANPQ